MVSSWCDEVYCTKRKDGTFSLRVRKTGEYGNYWYPGVTRIKSPRAFLDVYQAIDVIDIDQIDLEDDALPELSKIDPEFAERVRNELRKDEIEEEKAEQIDEEIQTLLKRAKIEYPNGTTNARVYHHKIWQYVFDYIQTNGSHPIGVHRVSEREVHF
jgi:hypothetical protein